MKKLLFTFVLGCTMLFAFVQPTFASQKFSDVQEDYPSKAEIDYLIEKNIINGYPDGTFKPNNNVTRLQAVKMIIKSREIDVTNVDEPALVDITPMSDGYEYIAKAVELGIIRGKANAQGERYFDSHGELTRAQMAKVISVAYGLTGGSESSFPDVTSSHWAYPHVQNLIGNRITKGYENGHYGPDDTITRRQFSVMMARALEDDFKVTDINKPDAGSNSQVDELERTANDFLATIENNVPIYLDMGYDNELGFENYNVEIIGKQEGKDGISAIDLDVYIEAFANVVQFIEDQGYDYKVSVGPGYFIIHLEVT